MESFYRNLIRTPDRNPGTKADAPRLGVLTMMKGGRYGHPFYWSGFVLIGDNKFLARWRNALSRRSDEHVESALTVFQDL
jgi:hypothetical protein